MNFEEPKNPNYCATVVTLKTFVDLPGCDFIKAAIVFENNVIVSKDFKVGDVGLFFPVECQLSKEFLSANNLYRKPECGNIDITKSGFFEEHGRIKCVRFRGHKSEGFWIPLSSIDFALSPATRSMDFIGGETFDQINSIEICRKYIPKSNNSGGLNATKAGCKLKDIIVEGQFAFHYDTENLKKNIHKIHPDDIISISEKFHGTSGVFSNVLINRKLSFIEKLLLKCGVKIQKTEYNIAYSSRKVIKSVTGPDKDSNDLWNLVALEIQERIPKNYSIYGEICGYMPSGKAIQAAPGGKAYHYGCEKGKHQLFVYRVTSTNPDGKIIELNWPQKKEFCTKYGFEMVKELYYGTADQFFSWDTDFLSDPEDVEWQKALLKTIESEFVRDQLCPWNNGEVPAEGIVVCVDHLEGSESFKMKNYLFLEGESKLLDSGVADIETIESEE